MRDFVRFWVADCIVLMTRMGERSREQEDREEEMKSTTNSFCRGEEKESIR